MNSLFAIEVDPMVLAGAVVMVLAGIGGMCVQIINAYYAGKERTEAKIARTTLIEKANVAAASAAEAAVTTAVVAKQNEDAHQKLDSIKSTTEEAAENVNGNLSAVRTELAKSMDLNNTLLGLVQSLLEAVKTQRAQSRATDKPMQNVAVVKAETIKEVVKDIMKSKE